MVDWIFFNPSTRERVVNANDALVFRWTGHHDVYLMESEDKFNNCDFTGATLIGYVSPTTYTVWQFPAYFGCSVPGHCQDGMKLKVTKSKSRVYY